jgi:hypothetical protein
MKDTALDVHIGTLYRDWQTPMYNRASPTTRRRIGCDGTIGFDRSRLARPPQQLEANPS